MASYTRHGLRVVHAIADDERGASLFRAAQERRQLRGVMLAIAVQGDGPVEAEREEMRQAGLQRRAFAAIAFVANYGCAGVPGILRGSIRRAVVHNDDVRDLLQQGRNQRGDGLFFVETGDNGGAVHEGNLAETFSSSKSGCDELATTFLPLLF